MPPDPRTGRRRTLAACGALAGGGLAGLTGCAPLAVLDALVPDAGYTRAAGIAYGDGPRRRLDLYRPRAVTTASQPIVVFFYGGNWTSGDRADYRFVGQSLASRGCIVAVPDYRLYPEVRFPAFVDDAAAAVRCAVREGVALGGDPGRVFLMGHSAGAHLAAMVALDPVRRAAAGLGQGSPAGWIGLAGPYDFLPLGSPLLRAIFAAADPPEVSQPIHHAGPDAPPALLIIAEHDDLVDPGNSRRLARRLTELGVPVRLQVEPDLGHRRLVLALATPLRRLAPVLDAVTRFIGDPRSDGGPEASGVRSVERRR